MTTRPTQYELTLYYAIDAILHSLAGASPDGRWRLEDERNALRRVFFPPLPPLPDRCPECLGTGYIEDEDDLILCECQVEVAR